MCLGGPVSRAGLGSDLRLGLGLGLTLRDGILQFDDYASGIGLILCVV